MSTQLRPEDADAVSATPLAPAAWYPDPVEGGTALRYWDGTAWTPWQSRFGIVSRVPLSLEAAHTKWLAAQDERAEWPGKVAVVAVLALVASGLLAVASVFLGDAIGLGTTAWRLALASTGLYAGLFVTCRYVAGRWGTGRGFAADFGIHYRKWDWWKGLVASLFARSAAAMVAAFLVILIKGLRPATFDVGESTDLGTSAVIVFAVIAVLAAPFVEELFFRGLLQRSLETVLPGWAAVVVQGSVFGLAHATLSLGLLNVVIVGPITAAGFTLGYLARRYHRLGPGIATHAFFNALAVAVMLIGTTSG